MKYERPHLSILKKRLKEKRRFFQVVMGPRQVGKTTMITQLLKGLRMPYHFISADAVPYADTFWIEQQWQTARLMFRQSESADFLLVIDEIQKVQNWSEQVKKCWDEDSRRRINLRLILLGSSRLLLQMGLTESLAGRFESIYMGHWSFTEMQAAFGWKENRYVWYGGYPGSANLIRDEARWKQYVGNSLIETSISKDILMLSRVDKPALMKRLFELGCGYSGQILSYNKMLGQMLDAGNTTTLAHYLQLLHTAGLLCGIEKLAADKIRQRGSSPKFQVHNTALISAQRPESFGEVQKNPALWGRMVESAVGAHLLDLSLGGHFELYYWREGNDEVDFVLRRGKELTALEVKSGTPRRLSGMKSFLKKHPEARSLLIGEGGMPWQDFLKGGWI